MRNLFPLVHVAQAFEIRWQVSKATMERVLLAPDQQEQRSKSSRLTIVISHYGFHKALTKEIQQNGEAPSVCLDEVVQASREYRGRQHPWNPTFMREVYKFLDRGITDANDKGKCGCAKVPGFQRFVPRYTCRHDGGRGCWGSCVLGIRREIRGRSLRFP